MVHLHIRIQRWVLWWIYIGVLCGVVALVNILFRDLTRTQERIILIIGILHWILGGLVCWSLEGIQIQTPQPLTEDHRRARTVAAMEWHAAEWHPASDFIFRGNRKSLLPPRY